MIDLQAIVALNAAAIILLSIVLINARITTCRATLDNKLFDLMANTAIAQAIIDTVSFFTTGVAFPGSYWFNVIINDLLYINNGAFAFLWTLYVDSKLFGEVRNHKKRLWFTAIPAIGVIAASIVNLFVPIFFAVDKVTFEYTRTKLFFIPIIIVALYLLYGFVLVCKYRSRDNRYLFFPAMTFLIPITLAVLTEYVCYGLNVFWIGAAISLTSIYISLQNQVCYIDSLSGLYTRQYLTLYLQAEMKKVSPDNMLYGIMLDIDAFKSINDTYGHLIGDEAIKAAGNILRHALPAGAVAFRFGGDEFMVMQTSKADVEFQGTIDRILDLTQAFNAAQGASYQLSFSIGAAVCDSGKDTLDDFLARMDSAMYSKKHVIQRVVN